MHFFSFKNDELHCEELSVRKIAAELATPFYLYSQKTIVSNFERIERAFHGLDHLICYALKANSNATLLALLAARGAGADVVSRGELFLALKSGVHPQKIVYAGVGKRDDEIEYALAQNILAFNVESLEELAVINGIAKEANQIAPVAIRVNPNIDIHGHPYISTGKGADKFGIALPAARALIRDFEKYPNLRLVGLHSHIGSQINEVSPYVEAVKILKELAAEARRVGGALQYVDIGGGLGVSDKNIFENENAAAADKPITVERLVEHLRPDFQSLGCKIIFEPGRALAAEAGILVTRVLYQKESHGKRFVIVDAGMNDLIRPSLYGAYHEIVPVCKRRGELVNVDVVGPICESGDFLGRDRRLPELRRGDLLAIMTAGAYGFVLSSNYNARPRPAEVLVEGAQSQVIRPAGDLEKLWS
jgi:diaminopimelate decarboxylase